MSQAALTGYENLAVQVSIPIDSYVLTYVGDTDVYFDDMGVVYTPTVQVQKTYYNP